MSGTEKTDASKRRQQAGLSLGPESRWRRQDIADRIADGAVDLPQLLEGDGDETTELDAGRMAVARLVHNVPGLTRPAADRLLGAARIGGTTALRDTTIAARRRLAALLRSEAGQAAPATPTDLAGRGREDRIHP